jgi:hypothetical protein
VDERSAGWLLANLSMARSDSFAKRMFVCSERKTGATNLTKARHAKLEYGLHYQNTGHTIIVDFVVEDELPHFVRSIVARDKEIDETFHKKREALLVNQRQDGG